MNEYNAHQLRLRDKGRGRYGGYLGREVDSKHNPQTVVYLRRESGEVNDIIFCNTYTGVGYVSRFICATEIVLYLAVELMLHSSGDKLQNVSVLPASSVLNPSSTTDHCTR